jgi:hypothetical protein
MDVFGELGVIGGGEDQVVALAVFARRHAQRALGGDMDGIGAEGLDLPDQAAIGQDRQLDLGVSRTRDAAEFLRPDHLDRMAPLLQHLARLGQGAHHAVDLGVPCIGNDQNAHFVVSLFPRARSPALIRRFLITSRFDDRAMKPWG